MLLQKSVTVLLLLLELEGFAACLVLAGLVVGFLGSEIDLTSGYEGVDMRLHVVRCMQETWASSV